MSLVPKPLLAFAKALPASLRDTMTPSNRTAELLASKFARAQERWSSTVVAFEVFATYIAHRLPTDLSVHDGLKEMHTDELYLACACASGDELAIEVFDQEFRMLMQAALSRIQSESDIEDEVRQRVYEKLFVSSADCTPKIATYNGRGPLAAWVRATTIREALSIIRKAKKTILADEAIADTLSDDPEMMHLKGLYRQVFKNAFETSFANLKTEDRLLLRHKYCDGANIDDLATLHKVHRATAARWLATIRDGLLTNTRSLMLKELGTSDVDLDSIFRLIQSVLDVSISEQLGRS